MTKRSEQNMEEKEKQFTFEDCKFQQVARTLSQPLQTLIFSIENQPDIHLQNHVYLFSYMYVSFVLYLIIYAY